MAITPFQLIGYKSLIILYNFSSNRFYSNKYLDKYLACYAQNGRRSALGYHTKSPLLLSDINHNWSGSINIYR